MIADPVSDPAPVPDLAPASTAATPTSYTTVYAPAPGLELAPGPDAEKSGLVLGGRVAMSGVAQRSSWEDISEAGVVSTSPDGSNEKSRDGKGKGKRLW